MASGVALPVSGRPWTPLALALGLHLLLVLAWLLAAPRGAIRDLTERASTVVFVQPPPRLRSPPPASAPVRRPRAPAGPALAPLPAPPLPPTAQADAPAPEPDTPPAALPGDLLASSKRMAGAVDRALRKGGSPITAEPERKWERFAAAVASARTGVGRDTILDSHTAGDGVVIYRKTVGERVRCYVGGSVGGIGPADGHSAGSVSCPTGVSWTRL